MAKESKELVVSDGSGTALAEMDDMTNLGFQEEHVLKVGDPEEGGIAAYAGQLIGAGPDIELNEAAGGGVMPTWQFHPLMSDGKGGLIPNLKATHTVICSAQLDSGYKRAQAQAQSTGKKIQVFARYEGKGKNRTGQALNKFRIASRIVD